MMDKLLAKVTKAVTARADRVADALVEAARSELPKDLKVVKFDEAIIVEGKALAKRALTEAVLRGFALLARRVLK